MSVEPSSDFVSFDSEAALEAAALTVGDYLRFCAEYNGEDYRRIFVADWLREVVGGEQQLEDLSEQFHSYTDLDRREREVMEELPPLAGDVRANVTRLDNAVFVRYYVDDDALFLTVATEADVTGLIDALDATIGSS